MKMDSSTNSRLACALLSLSLLFAGCAQQPVNQQAGMWNQAGTELLKQHASVFGADNEFTGSPFPDIGLSGLFPTYRNDRSRVAILHNGEDSFAARIQTLKKADTSIRIQALVFTADEAGLYIADLLKQKKRQGLDVRVIVDAFSNPALQTQRMFFDLKQNALKSKAMKRCCCNGSMKCPYPI